MSEEEYSETVLAELQRIREAMEQSAGKLDMLAVMDEKLGMIRDKTEKSSNKLDGLAAIDEKLTKRPFRIPFNLFGLLGLSDAPMFAKIVIIAVILLAATGHADSAADLLTRLGGGYDHAQQTCPPCSGFHACCHRCCEESAWSGGIKVMDLQPWAIETLQIWKRNNPGGWSHIDITLAGSGGSWRATRTLERVSATASLSMSKNMRRMG